MKRNKKLILAAILTVVMLLALLPAAALAEDEPGADKPETTDAANAGENGAASQSAGQYDITIAATDPMLYPQEQTLPGVTFCVVKRENGEAVFAGETGTEGKINFFLPVLTANYDVYITGVPEGYTAQGPETPVTSFQTIDFVTEGSKTIFLSIERQTAAYTQSVRDALTKEPVYGARIDLTRVSDQWGSLAFLDLAVGSEYTVDLKTEPSCTKTGQNGEGAIKIFGLPWGSYTAELRSAQGYCLTAGPINFSTGKLADGQFVTEVERGLELTPTRVNIQFINQDGQPVSGAEFTLEQWNEAIDDGVNWRSCESAEALLSDLWHSLSLDSLQNNSYVQTANTWATGSAAKEIYRLPEGIYRLMQTGVPGGYEAVDTIYFDMTETGEVSRIGIVRDGNLTDPPSSVAVLEKNGKENTITVKGIALPVPAPSSDSSVHAPKTGDGDSLFLYLVLGAVSAALIVCFHRKYMLD